MTTLGGRYEIIRELGGGGFAITYLAKDHYQPSKPQCVVKQLRPNQNHPRVIEFFEKEAAILEKLGKHPQIPQLFAHFQEDQNLYIVQEFIAGQDLSEEILPGKRLSEGYVTKLLQEVLEVLSFVHNQGVIHRDIKPQNLMRRHEDGQIFLIDFGAVKELGTLMVNAQNQVTSSVVIGTAGYMPSEQKNGRPCLGSDVYALGITVIQALTGISPVDLSEDPDTGEVIWQQKVQISQDLGDVLTNMVRRHQTRRYQGATEALQALRLTISSTVASPSQSPSLSVPPAGLSRRRVFQTFAWVAAGFGVAVAGEIVLKSTSEHQTSVSPPNKATARGELPVKQVFKFAVVTVDNRGDITKRSPGEANFFTENLDNGITLEMVEIAGGKFLMGSPELEEKRELNESPQHTVTIQPFSMGKFVVTQEQYQAVMGNNPSGFKGAKLPVERVNWHDATEFCTKLTQKTGRTYRLPSEAEWEYACRAGTNTPSHFGKTITPALANYNGSYNYAFEPKGVYRGKTTDVRSFSPNDFGLHDMHGNVWEWCQDNYHSTYDQAPNDGNPWLNSNENQRMLRGGSWTSNPRECRSAYRNRIDPDYRNDDVGFRVVVSGARTS